MLAVFQSRQSGPEPLSASLRSSACSFIAFTTMFFCFSGGRLGEAEIKSLLASPYKTSNELCNCVDASFEIIPIKTFLSWGGAHLCTIQDEARFPHSPTSSKYLNAGGYIGAATNLAQMVREVRSFAEECQSSEVLRRTRECGSGEGNPDQYLFMKFFWANQDTVALDVHQSIFGNFIEIEKDICPDGWKPRCAVTPCCTTSDRIENFGRLAYRQYQTRGCGTFRRVVDVPGFDHPERVWANYLEGGAAADSEEEYSSSNEIYKTENDPPWNPPLNLGRTELQSYLQKKETYLMGSSEDSESETLTDISSDSEGNVKLKPNFKLSFNSTELSLSPTLHDKTNYPHQDIDLFNLPISWHGNGCGKWIYILSLDALSGQCPVVSHLAATEGRHRLKQDQEVLTRLENMQKRRWNDER